MVHVGIHCILAAQITWMSRYKIDQSHVCYDRWKPNQLCTGKELTVSESHQVWLIWVISTQQHWQHIPRQVSTSWMLTETPAHLHTWHWRQTVVVDTASTSTVCPAAEAHSSLPHPSQRCQTLCGSPCRRQILACWVLRASHRKAAAHWSPNGSAELILVGWAAVWAVWLILRVISPPPELKLSLQRESPDQYTNQTVHNLYSHPS